MKPPAAVLLVELERQLLRAAARHERKAAVAAGDGIEAGGLIERAEQRRERLAVWQLVQPAGVGRAGLERGEHGVEQLRVGDQVQRQQQVQRAGLERELAVLAHEDIPVFRVLRVLGVQAPGIGAAGLVCLGEHGAMVP